MVKFFSEKKFMQKALDISLKGNPSPNPFVGCIIVKNNKIISKGFHKKFGEKHAEINALQKAGKKAKNAELYVSLEPCSHYGKTPPCVNAIINSKIKKVFIALKDPNKLVNGKGIKKLKKAGINVKTGLLKKQAEKINKAFIKFQKTKKPYVILKTAMTLDGKIASQSFNSKWISNKKSRKKVHEIRNKVDAILVGENTVIKDNPKLTSRIKNGRNPLRIIVAGKKLSSKLNVFADENFLIATTNKKLFKEKKFKGKIIELKIKNKKAIKLKEKNNLVNLNDLMKILGKKGISSVLIEGGSKIYTSFLKQKLIDKFVFFIAPKILGKGIPVFGDLKTKKINKAVKLTGISVELIESDLMITAYPEY